jgi:excinuclease ABC subunit C
MPNTIGNWLSEKRGSRTNIHVPQRGRKHQLVEMATKNARLILDQKDFNFAVINDEDPALLNLQKLLGLPRPPQRIEGFDISNLGERFTVASMVVMENGEPKKSEYRHFKIRGVNGQNDYASMREVISRRFRQTTAENRFPDLILIDGGKGQLNSAYHVLKQLGLAHFPIIGLAKRFERVYLPEQKDPIAIPREDPTLHLIQRIRDEAHRFALHYHRKLRVQNLTHSVLDDIPLVGKKRKKVLLRHFRSIDEIRNATIEKLLAVETINRQVAENIHKHLSYM